MFVCLVKHECLILKGVLVSLINDSDRRRTNVGYLDTMIDGVASFGRLERRCHNSSVTNGMKGWSSRRP